MTDETKPTEPFDVILLLKDPDIRYAVTRKPGAREILENALEEARRQSAKWNQRIKMLEEILD